ncbi:MAG: hypothetical protein AAF799_33445 [Myxococcota bacterium]
MTIPAPFAYGFNGRWLTSTHEHEVFICDGNEDHTVHIVALDAAVAGVRNTVEQILAVDVQGMLRGIDPLTGQTVWTHSVGHPAVALAATETGRWAVVHDGGISWGEGAEAKGQFALPDARFARFDPSGQVLAVAGKNGSFRTVALDGQPGPAKELGFDATGLAHSRVGWWLVSTTRGVFRIPVDGGEPELYLKWGGEHPPMHVACSQNGKLCAFTTEDTAVVLFGVQRDANCGAIVYHGRVPGELEFGPGAWIGIGIGQGDGNKIDLIEGACHRTDPPPDRERNRWMVQLGFDKDEIAEVHGPVGSAPAGGGGSADPRTQWGANAESGGDAPPTAGMLVYAVGLLGITGFLAYTALSDWWDDPFWAWLGVFILGLSGISILVSSMRSS